MGYIYRPKLKGSGSRLPESLAGCRDPRHGREDTCPGCGARFSKTWWAKYYANGVPVRESTHTGKKGEARRFLKMREGRTASGESIHPRIDRIRYEEADADLRTHYKTSGARDVKECEFLFHHLEAFFRTKRIAGIGPSDITRYIARRQEEGAANASVSVDGKMFAGKDGLRVGARPTPTGADLIVWLKWLATKPTTIIFSKRP